MFFHVENCLLLASCLLVMQCKLFVVFSCVVTFRIPICIVLVATVKNIVAMSRNVVNHFVTCLIIADKVGVSK